MSEMPDEAVGAVETVEEIRDMRDGRCGSNRPMTGSG